MTSHKRRNLQSTDRRSARRAARGWHVGQLAGRSYAILKRHQQPRHWVPYTTYFRYAGELAPGATVLFGGIKMGQVAAVQPGSEDPTRIEVRFAVKTGTPLNENSTARGGAVSIMRSPALTISTGTNDTRRLAAGEIVPSRESVSLDEITSRLATVADSANTVMLQLQRIPATPGRRKRCSQTSTGLLERKPSSRSRAS